ncbi:MAG: hypothetical protein ABEJ91_02255 [Candidatus Nanohaloarchaea archaeon]
MNDSIDRIDTVQDNPQVSQVYTELREDGAEDISMSDRPDYSLVISVDGEEYGVEVDQGLAATEKKYRELGAEVSRTRESRGSASAGILDGSTETMTVKEAASPLGGAAD